MAVTAKLVVRLLANDVVVAESEDEALWQGVLSSISSLDPSRVATAIRLRTRDESEADVQESNAQVHRNEARDRPMSAVSDLRLSLVRFAQELDLDPKLLEGACNPSIDPPFIHLDHHHWEAFRKALPARGPHAMAPIVPALTLLCLWRKFADGFEPSIALAKNVLDTVKARDSKPSRGLKNCEWLQNRGESVSIHPAKYSRAVSVARSYVTSPE